MVTDIKEIELYMKDLDSQIRELEKLKEKAEEIELTRSKECCPDVCSTINKSISNLRKEVAKAESEKKKILKVIEKSAQSVQRETLEHQALRKTQRVEILLKERMAALESLKNTLDTNKVCFCKKM